MIDIYDEVGYIKTVLQDGLSEKWERDATLLVRYYKSQGERKRDVRKKLKEKCENSKKFRYDALVDFRRLNKIIDNAWKKEIPLREIKEIVIPREVVDWFITLEEKVILSEEEVERLKVSRPHVTIKKNIMNWQRTKYLFTLYIWTKVQENYLDRPNMHYLKQYYKRFKQDANLKDSFSMPKERDLLFDLGYINVNYALGIDTIFMKNNDIFSIPITENNKVILKGEDMYNCGYWLEKQKMGTFICKNCGREFAHYTKSKQEKGRKYCKECYIKLYQNKTGAKKEKAKKTNRYCIDCGKECVILNPNDFKTCRCPECQSKRVNEQMKLYRQERLEGKYGYLIYAICYEKHYYISSISLHTKTLLTQSEKALNSNKKILEWKERTLFSKIIKHCDLESDRFIEYFISCGYNREDFKNFIKDKCEILALEIVEKEKISDIKHKYIYQYSSITTGFNSLEDNNGKEDCEKQEGEYCVYRHISPSGKSYIGITKNIKKRWGTDGSPYELQKKFWGAIEKYGWENFKHEILEDNISKEYAYNREMHYIKIFDSINNGYNVAEGGRDRKYLQEII